MERAARLAEDLPTVCRLGLATRGSGSLRADDVEAALDRGVNYLNWCGEEDGLSEVIARMGRRREQVVIAWQPDVASPEEMRRAIDDALRTLHTDTIDVVTLYYIQSEAEWRQLARPGDLYDVLLRARSAGKIRLIGLTSHERSLAAKIARGELNPPTGSAPLRPLDLLMIRYNAAHRGAETDVFPTTQRLNIPTVAFTCLRWGCLLRPTPDDPPGAHVFPATEWYRFVLSRPQVGVALMAPSHRAELDQNLSLLDDWRPTTPREDRLLIEQGARVRLHAGQFP